MVIFHLWNSTCFYLFFLSLKHVHSINITQTHFSIGTTPYWWRHSNLHSSMLRISRCSLYLCWTLSLRASPSIWMSTIPSIFLFIYFRFPEIHTVVLLNQKRRWNAFFSIGKWNWIQTLIHLNHWTCAHLIICILICRLQTLTISLSLTVAQDCNEDVCASAALCSQR